MKDCILILSGGMDSSWALTMQRLGRAIKAAINTVVVAAPASNAVKPSPKPASQTPRTTSLEFIPTERYSVTPLQF